MTEFPHVSPVVLRFLEWMGPQVAARRRRTPPHAAVAVKSAVVGEEPPAATVESPVVQAGLYGKRQVASVEATEVAPAPVSRLLEAAARRFTRREAALGLAPGQAPTQAPTQAQTQAPTPAPAGAPGPAAAQPTAPEHRATPTGWPIQAEYQAPWATPQVPLTQSPAGSFPGPAPDQARPGPTLPGMQQPPLLAPGPPAWEQAAAAWAGPAPALQSGLAPPPIAQGFGRLLRPPVAQDEAPRVAPKAPAPGTQSQSQSPAPGGQGATRLLEEARLRQMLAEILRADALRHGLDLKER